MIDIPPDIQIKSTIKPGSVYYFVEETFSSEEPHYFITINHNPICDEVLLLVCASSQIQKVRRRRRTLLGTVVEIKKEQYNCFTKDSIVDCNNIFPRKVSHLVEKLKQGKMKFKAEMDIALVNELRKAAIQSPLVEERTKKLLCSG